VGSKDNRVNKGKRGKGIRMGKAAKPAEIVARTINREALAHTVRAGVLGLRLMEEAATAAGIVITAASIPETMQSCLNRSRQTAGRFPAISSGIFNRMWKTSTSFASSYRTIQKRRVRWML
jgi:hypothetical protein